MSVVRHGSESWRGGAGSWQVSLGGLIVLVLAAGMASGVARSAREVWGTRTVSNGSGTGPASSPVAISEVPLERTVGLVLEIADVFLIVILARGLIGLFRGFRPAGGQERRGRFWSIAWRVMALCFLLWFLSEESRVLRYDLGSQVEQGRRVHGWGERYRLWQAMFPVCGLLAILGLALGMGAGFLLQGSCAVRRRPYWLFVFLAAVIAVLLVGIPSSHSLVPYLVLLAIEAVTNAMQNRLVDGPGLSTRLIRAGIEASAGALACLALALAIARDFERLRRGEPWMTSRMGRVIRLVLLGATAAGGINLINVTIPAIHPCLAEGFGLVIGPIEVGMIV
jgi:hypothetical protein